MTLTKYTPVRAERLYWIVDLLCKAEEYASIRKKVLKKYGIGLRMLRKDMEEAKAIISRKTNRNVEEHFNIAIMRYDQQYRQCVEITNVKERLEQQRRITEARCRLTGADAQQKVGNLNIFNFFPDQEILSKYKSDGQVVEVKEVKRRARGRGFQKGYDPRRHVHDWTRKKPVALLEYNPGATAVVGAL